MKSQLLPEKPLQAPAVIWRKRRAKAEGWDAVVREDHRALKTQADVLDSALGIQVGDQERHAVLSWTLRNLWPEMELHLRKEEETLFSALERLLGSDSGALAMLRREHANLRAGFRHLAELLQDLTHLEWDRIDLAVEGFLYLLEEHEKLGDRLLLDVLQYNLGRKERVSLMKDYQEVAERARVEEGWLSCRLGKEA